MRNDYLIKGDTVIIFMKRKNGEIMETKVSLIDLEFLKSVDVSFFPSWNPRPGKFYVNFHIMNKKGRKSKKALHRLIMGDPPGMTIDHINHDTLDNRRTNLRIVTQSQNMQNINPNIPKNSVSGYRNVSWHKAMKKWRVRLSINREVIIVGYYDDVHEASRAAEEARERYYTHNSKITKEISG